MFLLLWLIFVLRVEGCLEWIYPESILGRVNIRGVIMVLHAFGFNLRQIGDEEGERLSVSGPRQPSHHRHHQTTRQRNTARHCMCSGRGVSGRPSVWMQMYSCKTFELIIGILGLTKLNTATVHGRTWEHKHISVPMLWLTDLNVGTINKLLQRQVNWDNSAQLLSGNLTFKLLIRPYFNGGNVMLWAGLYLKVFQCCKKKYLLRLC